MGKYNSSLKVMTLLIWSYSEYVLLLTPASQKKNTFSIDNLLDMTEVAEQINQLKGKYIYTQQWESHVL